MKPNNLLGLKKILFLFSYVKTIHTSFSMKKIVLFAAFVGIGCATVQKTLAQDIHFSQYYNSPLTLNPALAGAYMDNRVSLNYKDQWRSVATAYKTLAFSYDMKLFKDKWQNGYLGAGLNVFSDRAGDANMATTQINLSIASHRKLNAHNSVSLGLQGGYAQRAINTNKLTWDNQYQNGAYDPGLPSGENFATNKFGLADFSAGFQWQYGKDEMYISGNDAFKANFGAAYFHVNQPKYSFLANSSERLYSKLVMHGNMFIGIKNTSSGLVPSFLYTRQGSAQELMVGAMVKYLLKEDSKYTGFVKGAAVSIGGSYRFQDAVVLQGLLEMGQYALGISYDINTSDLSNASNGRGGIEIMLRFVNPNPFMFKTVWHNIK